MYSQITQAIPSLGAFPTDKGTLFRVWSSTARAASVVVGAEEARPLRLLLNPCPNGVFELETEQVHSGARYHFELDGEEVADPYARCLPDGVFAPAQVWAPGRAVRPPAPVVAAHELVIYELHVGTFTPEGTFLAAAAKLPHLRELGVTCLELLPLSSFPGRWGWGYDGVAPFAPNATYGSPDALLAFIDAAHRLGMLVLLDLVLNHFGPDGNALGRYSAEYYTSRHKTPWGDALNYSLPWMRQLALDSVDHWLGQYRFDGLRLDATHEIFDDSSTHILDDLAARVRAIGKERGERTYLYAEDDRNAAHLVTHSGLDGVWADDFHHQLHVLLTGEQDGYYRAYRTDLQDLAHCISRGWLYEGQVWPVGNQHPRGEVADELPASAFVYCLQNHDQIGNRALGDRVPGLSGAEGYLAASTLLLFLPMTPLVFQGQEWMASTPFLYFSDHHGELGRLITEGRQREFAHFEAFSAATEQPAPDPQSGKTFQNSKLCWTEREQGLHRRTLQLYRALLKLRREDPALRGGRTQLQTGTWGDVLWVKRWAGQEARVLLLNLSGMEVDVAALLGEDGRPLLSTGQFGEGSSLPGRSAGIYAVPLAWTAGWAAPPAEGTAQELAAATP